jgi:thiol:disulfide interchange protein DsbC
MKSAFRKSLWGVVSALALTCSLAAHADEAAIRKKLADRLTDLPPVDEITQTPMSGLYEVRIGNNVLYSDAQGDFLIQGELIDTSTSQNLTATRLEKLNAVDFKELQKQNAFAITRGNGKRQIAIFEDPNCGYCKSFERNLQSINNITAYVFLIPILGNDSKTKSNQIWCSKDPAKAWQDWMVRGIALTGRGDCNTQALQANLDFAHKYRIDSTPTLLFPSGRRVSGALPASQVERLLQ